MKLLGGVVFLDNRLAVITCQQYPAARPDQTSARGTERVAARPGSLAEFQWNSGGRSGNSGHSAVLRNNNQPGSLGSESVRIREQVGGGQLVNSVQNLPKLGQDF